MSENLPHKYLRNIEKEINKTGSVSKNQKTRGWYDITKEMGGQRVIRVYLTVIPTDYHGTTNSRGELYPEDGNWYGREVVERLVSRTVGNDADWLTRTREARLKNTVSKKGKKVSEYEEDVKSAWRDVLSGNHYGSRNILNTTDWITISNTKGQNWMVEFKGIRELDD